MMCDEISFDGSSLQAMKVRKSNLHLDAWTVESPTKK